ncbi:MAG TPA: ribosome biogenesis factor YjgA [Steroidobacteraceae bacterium]|nr:ribosome biogenesis factor YjgA [Steroidobacteraceae bacterium]
MKRFSRPESDAAAEADAEPLFDGPSKSVLKREAHRAQALGEQLIALKDSELVALELPEALYEAIVAARSINSRGGGTRQRQYIGKLMRDIDLTRVRETLGAKAAKAALEAQRFQRVENWRARLMDAGPSALAALRTAYPTLDEAQWLERIAAARTERERTGATGAAARELFRALREVLE